MVWLQDLCICVHVRTRNTKAVHMCMHTIHTHRHTLGCSIVFFDCFLEAEFCRGDSAFVAAAAHSGPVIHHTLGLGWPGGQLAIEGEGKAAVRWKRAADSDKSPE